MTSHQRNARRREVFNYFRAVYLVYLDNDKKVREPEMDYGKTETILTAVH